METYRFTEGRGVPVLVSMPHVGTALTPGLLERLAPAARPMGDTDWHLPLLYDFLGWLGCSVIEARYSRFVVDLNRPPDDTPLYKTATTGLFPDTLFDGTPLYLPGQEPDAAEKARRRETYWRPYHDRIEAEMTKLRQRSGRVVLLDAHSICSRVPRLFDGRLPDFNLGTADGASLPADLTDELRTILGEAQGYTSVVNGRFKGGYITRHYAAPDRGRYAVQLELVQETYMEESEPYRFRPDRAAAVRPHLRRFVEAILRWAEN